MDGRVDPAVVQDRFDRLLDLQNTISLQRNQAMVGHRFEVLVEGQSRKDEAMATARTRGGRLLHLPGVYAPGTFLDAVVTRAAPHHLMGALA
jgi:tRNA-2-methylthio-N6-dimethylallyladenosine synthase